MNENRSTASKKPPLRPGFGGGPGHMSILLKAKPKDRKKTIGRLWQYLRRRSLALALVFALVLLGTLLTLTGPLLIGMAVDTMAGPGRVETDRLFTIVAAMVAIYALGALITWFYTYIMIGIAQDTVWELRDELFAKVQTLPLGFFDSRPHGELMSRLTNDVENINNTLSQSTTQVFASLISVIGAIAMMLYLSPLLTLLSLAVFPLGFAGAAKIAGKTRKYFTLQQKHLGELNGFTEETISGQKIIKAFVREEAASASFDAVNAELKSAGIRANIYSGLIMPLMNIMNNLSFAVAAGAGGLMAANGAITVGIIASFLNYSRQFSRPINEIANQFNMLQSALAGAERVFEIMDEAAEHAGAEEDPELRTVAGDVVFDNVSFGYKKDVPILKNVNIQARAGQTIALVGPTGAGKTTVVNLLTRFYDVDSGAILIDGKDIRTLSRDSLRRSLAIVLQDAYLFAESVRENIRYGRLAASDAEVEKAARIANADLFIQRLPQGYDTILTEDGANLSQGQRQLLTIARAILADPAILILDEATSNVDTRTEQHIQKAMLSLMEGRTSFVIAHRLSTIRKADQILVIDRGEIVERGSHNELLAARGFYHELYTTQLRRPAS